VSLTKKRGESLGPRADEFLSWASSTTPTCASRLGDQQYKPDLVASSSAGAPAVGRCGQTDLKKLDSIGQQERKTLIDIVKPPAASCGCS
jgi:hypothetical protein